MLNWFTANKDALIAVAALVSPVVAVVIGLISAVVSYRAVVTGPRIQREISQESLKIAARQVALQEQSLSANLIGIADQKWADGFADMAAEFASLMNERASLEAVRRQHQVLTADQNRRLTEVSRQLLFLNARIGLWVSEEDDPGMEFLKILGNWKSESGGSSEYLEAQVGFIHGARAVIGRRRTRALSRISARTAGAAR